MTEKDKKSIVSALKVLAISVFCVACIGIYLLFCFLLAADSLNYGEYGYIGKIILVTVLVASAAFLALALFDKTGKVKRVIALIACAILIASFFPLLDVTDKLCAKPYTEFSPENWNRTAQIHPNLLQYMVPDLEEKYNLVGMDISEVDKLLDLDNWRPSNYGREYYHRIGSAHTFLVIYYNENCKVTKVETTNDASRG